MKIHEMLVTELATNGEFRSSFLEYARERIGVFADGPIADWPFEMTAPAPTMKPDATEWRILDADEIIQDGDQWAPLHNPERWSPVGDSVGQVAGRYRKSRFRRGVASPHPVQRGALVVDDPIPAPAATPSAPPDGLQFATTVHPHGAFRYVTGEPCTTHHYEDIVRRPDGSIASARIVGIPTEAGEGYRILEEDEAVLFGDEFRVSQQWAGYTQITSGLDRRCAASRDWCSPIHRRALRYDVYWSPIVAGPDPVDIDARRRREWRVLEPHEVTKEGDRYAKSGHIEFVERYVGRTAGEILDPRGAIGIPHPVIRRIVTERDGLAARPGYRILDPEETVPSLPIYWTLAPAGQITAPGTRVGDRIIEVPITEVPNA